MRGVARLPRRLNKRRQTTTRACERYIHVLLCAEQIENECRDDALFFVHSETL
jgi:hypothetical protein